MGEKRTVCRLLVGKPDRKRPLGRRRRRSVVDIEMDLVEMGLGELDWTGLDWTGLVWLRIGIGGELL
jgi:hypothetical protein